MEYGSFMNRFNGRCKTQAYRFEALLAEVVVDVGGLHGQVSGGVEGSALILRRLIRGLTHRKQVYKGEKKLKVLPVITVIFIDPTKKKKN